MADESKTRMFDILTAINEIESFLIDINSFSLYQNDLKTKRAIERNIEIIGEAIHKISRNNKTIEFSNARKIVDTRNRIIHGYDTVSDEVLWGIVTNHLPILKEEVEIRLKE